MAQRMSVGARGTLLICLAACCSLAARPQPAVSLSERLSESHRLFAEGQITEALELLRQTIDEVRPMQTQNVVLREELLWQAATAHLDFAQRLTNPDQYRAYASRARDLWRDYIEWFDGLTPDDRRALGSAHTRIALATRHLGNANVRMAAFEQVLTDYANLSSPSDLGTDAISLWKGVLNQCPEWPTANREPLARRVCSEQCEDHWTSYADTLEQWAQEYYLTRAARQRYLNEAGRIRSLSSACSH